MVLVGYRGGKSKLGLYDGGRERQVTLLQGE